MGYGSYTAADWGKLRMSRNMDQTKGEREIFRQNQMNPKFDPKFIEKREARDSEDHPNSTPIIIGLDVTASMGYVSNQIARESLNETMMKLYSTNAIEDPAILFAAYGDYRDQAPLQVTQFESDIRIAEQLLDLWLENGGNGSVVPFLLWYFAAKHTKLDSYEKHGKKGFLITIGDSAECRNENMDYLYDRVFGETVTFSAKTVLEAAKEKFDVMHIFIDNQDKVPSFFTRMLPGRYMLIHSTDIEFLPEIIISAMQIASGMNPEKSIAQWTELAQPVVKRATALLTGNSNSGVEF